jgi:hemoglobin-like flavoprotein
MHASFLMEMIEKTVELMEEDNTTLTKSMMELGQKHVAFGVTPSYFPLMTAALIKMLKVMVPSFSEKEETAFNAVMSALIADMIKGQKSIDKGLAATKKVVVIQSWEKLTKIESYEHKGGILLFQQ